MKDKKNKPSRDEQDAKVMAERAGEPSAPPADNVTSPSAGENVTGEGEIETATGGQSVTTIVDGKTGEVLAQEEVTTGNFGALPPITEPPTERTQEPLRTDGPTLEEYVAAGYNAANYPPKGYAARTKPVNTPLVQNVLDGGKVKPGQPSFRISGTPETHRI